MKKSNVKILLIVTLMLMEGISLFLAYKSYNNRTNVKTIKNNNQKNMAIMLEDKDHLGTYNEYPENSWPGLGYILNIEMSSCIDNAGMEMEGLLTFDNETRIATVKSTKETYCYLYFKYDPAPVEMTGFSITEVKKNNDVKYTNLQRNKATLDWSDDDIQYFCLTESEENARVACEDKWVKSNGVQHIEVNYDFDNIDNEVKTVYAYTKDFGGSISPRKEDKIIVDTKGPTVTSTPNGTKNNDTNSWYKSMSISLSGEDGTFGIGMKEIKYCVTENSNCTPDQTLTGKEGVVTLSTNNKNQKLCYQAEDLLGQKGASGCTGRSYQVDGSNPTISFDDSETTPGSSGWFKKVVIKANSSDEGSGVESLKTCVTTGALCNPNSTTPNNQLGDNKNAQRVCAEVIDKAGNSSGIKCTDRTYQVDGTAPTCGPYPNKLSGMGTTSGVTGNVDCNDEASGCTSSKFGFTNLKETTNIQIKDVAGNTNICPVPIQPQKQKRTASCAVGKRCQAAGCESSYSYSDNSCPYDTSTCGAWYLQNAGTGCVSSCTQWQSADTKVLCLYGEYCVRGQAYREVFWRSCRRTNCHTGCNYYYQNASTCGCETWGNWSDWSYDPSCSASTSNTSQTECQVVYK